MMKAKIQLDLFAENDELTLLHKELSDLYQQIEKLKKTFYSRNNNLAKLCLELKDENDQLKLRLDKLEKSTQIEKDKKSDSDLLERLFKEAYLPHG